MLFQPLMYIPRLLTATQASVIFDWPFWAVDVSHPGPPVSMNPKASKVASLLTVVRDDWTVTGVATVPAAWFTFPTATSPLYWTPTTPEKAEGDAILIRSDPPMVMSDRQTMPLLFEVTTVQTLARLSLMLTHPPVWVKHPTNTSLETITVIGSWQAALVDPHPDWTADETIVGGPAACPMFGTMIRNRRRKSPLRAAVLRRLLSGSRALG